MAVGRPSFGASLLDGTATRRVSGPVEEWSAEARPRSRAGYGREVLRIAIRVRPGASHPGVAGAVDGRLQVRVAARAVDGRATEAALAAVADAFGVRRSAVTLVHGATSRDKLVAVEGALDALTRRYEELLRT